MTVRQHRLSDPPYPSDYIYPADKDYPLNEDWEGGPVALEDTSLGLNNQAWHLTYLADAPPAPYNPDIMQYDGVTGFYDDDDLTTVGNKVTVVCRFSRSSFTGDTFEYLIRMNGPTDQTRIGIFIGSGDNANADYQDKLIMICKNSAGVNLVRLVSTNTVINDSEHVVIASFDADTGATTFIIDEVNADDLGNPNRVTPVSGTLDTGASSQINVGASPFGALLYGGLLGYVGYKDAYLTNFSDFMDGSQPKQLDEITWTEWGGQPLFWRDTGDMELSLGTEGAMTKNGTITQVPADPIPGVFQGFQVTPEDTGDPVSVLSGVNSVQCGLAFDQNGHVTIVWVDQFDAGHLYWYDTTVGDWIITDFANPVAGVGLTLDDKRLEQTGASDILLWYTLAVDGHHETYTREQRDRFDIAYPMQPGLPVWPYFKKLGMADELRVQMTMTNVGPV